MRRDLLRVWFVMAFACAMIVRPRDARADQCVAVSASQATAARQMLLSAVSLVHLCEPCGERLGVNSQPQPVGDVALRPWSGGGSWVVSVGGRDLDLAYVFSSSDGVTFTNVARAIGCPASDVSLSFVLAPVARPIGSPYAAAPPQPFAVPSAPEPSDRLLPTAAAPSRSAPPTTRWRRPVGPVRMGITALFIAPGKSSGAPWDGPGTLPTDVQRGLQAGVTVQLTRQIFSAFVDTGSGVAVAARLAPWALNALSQATAAPDVQAALLLDGTQIGRAQTRTHTFTPSWPGMTTTAYTIGPNQQIVINAVDTDLLFNDHIGLCTMQGMPLVDRNGYARAEDFTCNGQLWGVRLRVLASSYEPVADADIPEAPPSAAAPAPAAVFGAPGPAPEAPPAATPPPVQMRRGGTGESCTRTDDCESPLRCIRHECTSPAP